MKISIHIAKCKAEAALQSIEAAGTLSREESIKTAYLIEARSYLREATIQANSLITKNSKDD